MRLIFLLVLIFLILIPLYGNSLQYSKTNSHNFKIHFQLPLYHTETGMRDGVPVRKIKIDASSDEKWQENMIGLPQIAEWIYIPDGYNAQITLENPIIDIKDEFSCDVEPNDADNKNWLDVSQPTVFRGNRILSFCIKPFLYDSQTKQLKTLSNASIKIVFSSTDVIADNSRYQTPSTIAMLKALCINRDDIRLTTQNPGSYVILYNGSTLTNTIQPFADWKRQKGFNVHMVNTATVGTTNAAIKAYIQIAYNTWVNPPEYILILGRATSGTYNVPTYVESFHYQTAGDYNYTLLDGTNDIIPDAYIGRLTFTSTDELLVGLNKIMQYEKIQNLSTNNWQNKSFLLGDPDQSGESCITTMKYVKGLIQDYNSAIQTTEAYSGYFPSQISAAINSGTGTYWYRGHGNFSSWTITDISNLNNSGKYPFISYVTCFTGNFNATAISQSERFMRVGSPNSPKGAVGVIGVSCETHSCLNNIVTGAFAYGMYKEGLNTSGPILVRGKLALMANYPQNPANYINQYFQSVNLFGDPSLDIMLQQITDINVTASSELFSVGGNAAVRVTLTDNTPLEGVWVSLSKGTDELAVSGYTDRNGVAILPYGGLTAGNAILTVTKAQYRPLQVSIGVNTSSPAITINNIHDSNHFYAGSNIAFPITITNNSADTLMDVTGVLQTQDELIAMPVSQCSFGTILPGANAVSQAPYQITIDSDFPKGKAINLNLHVTHNNGSLDIPISVLEDGPDFALSSLAFSNNILTQGINLLNLSLTNNSQTPISGLNAILESTNPLLVIQNPDLSIGFVDSLDTVTFPASYSIQVSESMIDGVNVRLNLRLFNANGFLQTLFIDKKVGTASTNDVTGPDAYGYICYGPGDNGYKPYNWLEIDPALGGNGLALNITDTDTEGSGAFSTINLPFQFRFYGRAYTQLTVCSNGFIMPGNQGSVEWMNWQIPGPMVPRPIIAPFWDDLLTDNQSKIAYYYHSHLHAMVIQWQNLKNKHATSMRETFQVLVYDPAFDATPTGDSAILFQYKVFNNVDSGNYGVSYVDHGQYATVGIGDHTGMNGITYSFNNQYPPTAQTLTNLSTLYFSTLPNYQAEPNPILISSQLSETIGNGNGLTDAGESFNMNVTIKNIGLGYLAESIVTITTTDPYVTITQNSADLQALFSNQNAATNPAYAFAISQNCPNQHVLQFNLNILSANQQFTLLVEVVVNAIQITSGQILLIDGNNDIPEPGETIQLSVTLNNISMLPAQNMMVSLIHPNEILVNPSTQMINVSAMNSQTVSYQLTLSNTIAQGSTIELGLVLEVPDLYDQLLQIPLLIGVPDVFLNSGFEEQDVSSIFPYMYHVNIAPSQYINTTGHEAVMYFNEIHHESYIFTQTMPANDILNSRIRFTWFNTNPGANLSLSIFYSNQANLMSIWNSSELTLTPQTVTVNLSSIPAISEYIVFVFSGTINGYNTNNIVIDDISIMTIHHAPGIISGHVNLDLHQDNVTQVSLMQRFSNTVYHPDNNGNFSIPAYQGQSIIYAYLEGYINPDDSLLVNVISGVTSTNNEIFLQKLRSPVNLAYTITDNVLNLTWGLEGQDDKQSSRDKKGKDSRYLIPDYYIVFVNVNAFQFQQTTTEQSYSRTLNIYGNYEIYIRSVFIYEDNELISNPSEELTFNFTSNPGEIELPLVFALNQNHPNPFNPTTQISFSLPENSKTRLNIYNLKGQLVKTLIDSDYSKGIHNVIWNGKDNNGLQVSSGVYYYKLNWRNKETTRKMIMLK